MDIPKIRSFIAIELPPEVKQALAELQGRLKGGGGHQVKWVEPQNMHLTLQFLGNIDAAAVDNITAATRQASVDTHPFQIEVSGLGVFPNLNRVQVIWVGLTGEVAKLAGLQKSLGAKLEPLGFKPESRPFTPHLTLGRVREFCRPEERAALGRQIEKTAFTAKYKVDVTAVNLMKSQLRREGPIYTKLASIELK